MLIVSDTFDQVNGVANTYKNLIKESKEYINILHPGLFKTIKAPYYPEVQLVVDPWKVYGAIKKINPEHLHIATEGVMGLVARQYCTNNNITYTTSYHTKWPEFMRKIIGIPETWSWHWVRWFHKNSKSILVPTPEVKRELEAHGFKNRIAVWTRGVAKELIASNRTANQNPIKLLSVGRVSKEKNLDEVCRLSDKYQVTIVGDGPYRQALEEKYPNVTFVGYKFGEELAKIYADHDVFVFPSRVDTFGIVMIESLCNGTPVAAYNVTGPKDVIRHGETGYLGENLEENIRLCLSLDCSIIKSTSVKEWSWANCLKVFLDELNQDHKS